MPATPYHFLPHSAVALALNRVIDWPTFLLANIFIDIQPLLVLTGLMGGPLHGLTHTYLFGGVIGVITGICSYQFLPIYTHIFNAVRFPYATNLQKMVLSGILGAWLHILTDSPIYSDIKPLYPETANPLYGLLNYQQMSQICLLFFPVAVVFYYRNAKKHSEQK
ncbi:MAG TPA: hypothetical protein VN367_03410 [Chlorobaculum sp.]|nr:hypothetical protein [Chlorobaculum sp.]